MRVHLVQKHCQDTDLRSWVDAALARGATAVFFPELAATGAVYESRRLPSLTELTEPLADVDPALTIYFGAAVPENDRVTNCYLAWRGGKEIGRYTKINLFPGMNEDKVYEPGRDVGRIDFGSKTAGVAICYDLRFPDLWPPLADGVERIFLPAAWPRIRIHDWQRLIVERARATETPVIGINAVGDDGTNRFGGSTMVVDTAGEIVAQADTDTVGVLEIDLA